MEGINLRYANLNDFEPYKELFRDEKDKYQWIWLGENKEGEPDEFEEYAQTEKGKKEIEEFFSNYTKIQFKKDMKKFHIFVIEQNKKVIGYISLWRSHHEGIYSVHEWAMFNPRNKAVREEVLKKLLDLKLENCRGFQIFTANKQAQKLLLANNFKKRVGFVIELED